jgi:hypothetical protein
VRRFGIFVGAGGIGESIGCRPVVEIVGGGMTERGTATVSGVGETREKAAVRGKFVGVNGSEENLEGREDDGTERDEGLGDHDGECNPKDPASGSVGRGGNVSRRPALMFGERGEDTPADEHTKVHGEGGREAHLEWLECRKGDREGVAGRKK